MNRAKLSVTNLLTAVLVRQQSAVPQFDLFGVDLRVQVPADTEFPRTLAHIDVFARFFVRQAGRARLRFRLQWERGVSAGERSIFLFTRQFAQAPNSQDERFRLANVRLPGEGWYHLTLGQRRRKGWKGRVWVSLATAVFYVERRV
jgi:hypothetical protein